MAEDGFNSKTKNKKGDIINLVSVSDWLDNIDKYSSLKKGVIIKPDDDFELLKDSVHKISLIAIDFSIFEEGRGYSQATLIKTRWNYSGEIKGINAHLDQLQFMIRSGIDTYELQEQYKGSDELSYTNGFNICYQLAPNNTGMKEKF